MNRVVSRNLGSIGPEVLPPRERVGPVRVLFLSCQTHGLKSNAEEMIRATAIRDDLDGVHVLMTPTPWMRPVMARLPGVFGRGFYDLSVSRRRWAWKRLVSSWLRGPLPLDRFDAVHVITRVHAMGVVSELLRQDPERRRVLALAVDATAPADQREFRPVGGKLNVQARFDVIAERWMYERVDLVQCRSRWVESSIGRDFGLERVPETVLVPPSITPPARVREPFAGDERRVLRIGLCGNPWYRKGGDRLVRWFAERWQDRAELHIVCRDAEIPAGVKNLHWSARIPREELFERFYPSLDLFVLPTRHDQITWVLCEAAHAGVACVGPRMAGIPEAIVHGKTGLVVDRHWDDRAFIEAVEHLMDRRDLIDKYGSAARRHAEENLNRDINYPRFIDRLVAMVGERKR